ncbi:MAG: diguanylate cyclase response regulator [Candidatus Omnitrophota bacterium]|nr:MAG: diguanylate cyclase response regulator [Candidatus Omnitrophota bacterium]
MVEETEGILIFTPDSELKEYIHKLLKGEGYEVKEANQLKVLQENLSQEKIGLLLIDSIGSGTIDICKKVRADFALRHIPIIVIVEKESPIEKIKVIYAGADDYIEKPINAGELLTRIKANLWRAKRDLDANPLTKLPGNVSIFKELEKRLKNKEFFCVGYADLDKFKEYNDYYGFEWGDKVIRHTAKILTNALKEVGSPNDFLGHIGGDDFIFITGWESINNVCENIIENFDKTIPSFYKEEDLKKGYIIVKNRLGKVTSVPIMRISIGVTTNERRTLTHVGQIIQIATELKTYAKTFSKSLYIIDRRRG